MKKFLCLVLLHSFFLSAFCQLTRDKIRLPDFADSITWTDKKIEKINTYLEKQLTKSMVILHKGSRVYEYGKVDTPYQIFSARKSIMSLLYGIYIDEAIIDPNFTLKELEIDDKQGLSDQEKEARIIDLLRARSGVYHVAAYETPGMVKNRPQRGEFKRDEHWYYNNWDFNALTTIFTQLTGLSPFEAFEKKIAEPLNMDYDISVQKFHTEEISEHVATLWFLSANDLAELGGLLLNGGKTNGGTSIIPFDWIEESTQPYSNAGIIGGYGYCWWASDEGFHYPFVNVPDNTYSARGTGEQNLIIIPEWDMVIVHLTEVTSPDDEMMHVTDFGKLLMIIFEQSWY